MSKFGAAVFDIFYIPCPYFTSQYSVNNWYGCAHPEQEETDPDEDGVERGKCYCWSCPLGIEADKESLVESDVDWSGCTPDPDCMEGEYLLVNVGDDASHDERNAWRRYQRYVNRYNPDWKEPEND